MRATLDKLISWTGLLIALLLVVAGGLMTWASLFIGDQVKQQFSQQNIVMPSGAALDALPAKDKAALKEFAGQDLTKGPQAKAYADHYILAHMNEASDGKSYSEVSSAQSAACKANATSTDCTTLTGLKNTLFQGNTLRGLLLYGYAFATVGTIAGYGAIAAFVGAILMLGLGLLGLRHARLAVNEGSASA